MRTHSVLSRSLTIAAIVLSVACGDDPTPVQPTAPTSAGQITSIQVVGPDSVAAGTAVQYVARITLSDGTTKSATRAPNLRWRSSNASMLSVSDSGVVTAFWSGYGAAAEITAEITSDGVHGTRHVVIPAKAVVTAELDLNEQGAPGQQSYVFTLKLTESAGVSAAVSGLAISFDEGWGAWCSWTPADLGQPRLPANGTLTLGPVTCGSPLNEPFSVDISASLKDDNGYQLYSWLYRSPVR
jgi:hypothetical protein